MDESMSTQEHQLLQFLADLPSRFNFRFTEEARRELIRNLFLSLIGGNDAHNSLFFPDGKIPYSLKLSDAQGAVEGAEYTEAARGKRCGHIFKPGEASYSCRTCGTDETCCLCSRCFDSTDHTGHMVRISMSVGNSGCCDCGDEEAWKVPLFCTIHSQFESRTDKGKEKEAAGLPEEVKASLNMTVGRVYDYICDVISCSPEQLRQAKTEESILNDEKQSRLSSKYQGSAPEVCNEFCMVLWNDEKHTVPEVRDQVARACRKSKKDGEKDAYDVDAKGRTVLTYNTDVRKLLEQANIMEAIRITVTVRSARDTFREEMCGAMVEWLGDIAGCAVGNDNSILRQTICEQMMVPWRQGSSATHTTGVIDDEEEDDQQHDRRRMLQLGYTGDARILLALQMAVQVDEEDEVESDNDVADIDFLVDAAGEDEDDVSGSEHDDDDDVIMLDDDQPDDQHNAQPDVQLNPLPEARPGTRPELAAAHTQTVAEDTGAGIGWPPTEEEQDPLEQQEASIAGYPPPPPPPPVVGAQTAVRDRDGTPSDSDTAEPLIAPSLYAKANLDIPKTPGKKKSLTPRPGRYWIETPPAFTATENVPAAENVFKRVRLDWLLLFDLRMWKKVRNDLRALYISTVVQVPEFKRVLAIRFSSLYTILAQLYLVGDREPDHSIIQLSLQMLTTLSITAEVVERGNFLSGLLAILYTFLTTRQVGHPWHVSPDAVLAFESGSVTNRRMYHFYQDLKYLFSAPHVQERIRAEPRYLMQFLDLVKLHQGIGPNTRAVVEHVEYEADSWITASLVTRQINAQARSIAEAFRDTPTDEMHHLQQAIRLTAKTVIINSAGAERARFKAGEIKDEVKFKVVSDYEFETQPDGRSASYSIVKFTVAKEPISFHHALHYTLSWLLECGRSLPASNVRELLSFTKQELKSQPRLMGRLQFSTKEHHAEDFIMAALDYPLRVCAWLAQVKANMWVRNGISLRHQASTYRGVSQRDTSHHRDIFLLQTALVICNPSRVLASVVDRFGVEQWVKGLFEIKGEAQDDAQHLDVVEDMIHLLIILLSDRTSLIPPEDEPNSKVLAMRRDITHVLCFKPLSFNDLSSKLPEKYQEREDFHLVLDEMATFKPPEGISDSGTFELRHEFIDDIDPYIAHYNRNQREEAEMAYRKKLAKSTGKTVEEVVYEPKPRAISSGLFKNLGSFTGTGMFAQIIYYALLYPLVADKFTPAVQTTRLETFLQVVLHLVLLAVAEDKSDENPDHTSQNGSFVLNALTICGRSNFMPEQSSPRTIAGMLNLIHTKEEFKSVHPKIELVMRRLKQKQPVSFTESLAHLGEGVDRIATASPSHASVEEERERKKKAALTRQAKVMAQFQQQQKSFMENQTIDWGSDIDDDEDETDVVEGGEGTKHSWKYPTGTCILCQEEFDDRKLYGTFALFNESRILRQTDLQDPSIVREASQTPCNLDRSAEELRPFGIARENRKMVEKVSPSGEVFLAERQTIGKGYPSKNSRPGTVASGCGHMMHYSCFKTYFDATTRRHTQQIARHHPEDTSRMEFVCPLCKALGNAFLPIVWKGLEQSWPGDLTTQLPFDHFIEAQMGSNSVADVGKARDTDEGERVDLWTPSLPGSLLESITQPWEKRAAEGSSAWNIVPDNQSESSAMSTPPAHTPQSSRFTLVSVLSNLASGGETTSVASPPSGSEDPRGDELLAAYRRLKKTMRVGKMVSRYDDSRSPGRDAADILTNSDTLVQAVAYSIAAAEIQHRGEEAQHGLTLLNTLSEGQLTHLRILSETASSYMLTALRSQKGDDVVLTEFNKECERQQCQLFSAKYWGRETKYAHRPLDSYPPLLSQDAFTFLVECAYGLVAANKMELPHVLRMCYLAELVRVVYHMSCNIPSKLWLGTLSARQTTDPAVNNFADFGLAVTKWDAQARASQGTGAAHVLRGENQGFQQPGIDTLESWYMFAKKYALTFLRKTAILLYVKHGIDFESHVSPTPDADELERLTETLKVPEFDEMCASLTDYAGRCGWPEGTREMVNGWIQHEAMWSKNPDGAHATATISHPGVFEMIGLPKNHDTLIEEATRKRCPTTGKDLTDPILCLFCGELFCGQATCCSSEINLPRSRDKTKIGGCQTHMRKCQQNIGAFLNVRRCAIAYLHRMAGAWVSAPYIDKYGEVDPQLRHGRQLFLNQKRYDVIVRDTVLKHEIPTLISRKLEAEINNGGWDTL